MGQKLFVAAALIVDGVKLPFRLQTTSSVQNFTITFTSVEHNVPIDPTLFVKPPAK